MESEDITELSRFRQLFVIARNSSFQYRRISIDVQRIGRELGVRYVLAGSFRQHDGRVRIAARLVDALTGANRWAERYDCELADVFGLQDDLARAIATTLVAHVNSAEAERTLLKPPTSWQAYEYFVRGAHILAGYWSSVKVADLYESRRLLEQSLAIDPSFARAYASLSTTWIIAWRNRLDKDHLNPAALDEAHRTANRAVQLNPTLPQAHASLGVVLVWKRQHDAGAAKFEKAAPQPTSRTGGWQCWLCGPERASARRARPTCGSTVLRPARTALAASRIIHCTISEALAYGECVLRAPDYGGAARSHSRSWGVRMLPARPATCKYDPELHRACRQSSSHSHKANENC